MVVASIMMVLLLQILRAVLGAAEEEVEYKTL